MPAARKTNDLSARRGDIVSSRTRSRMMRAVPRQSTSVERAVRRILCDLGISAYRLNNRRLPGSPDISNRKAGWAIFVHGCFWHGHRNCRKTKGGRSGRIPVTRSDFWKEKIEANRARDARKSRQLRALGLRVLTIWECELRNRPLLEKRILRFMRR